MDTPLAPPRLLRNVVLAAFDRSSPRHKARAAQDHEAVRKRYKKWLPKTVTEQAAAYKAICEHLDTIIRAEHDKLVNDKAIEAI